MGLKQTGVLIIVPANVQKPVGKILTVKNQGWRREADRMKAFLLVAVVLVVSSFVVVEAESATAQV